MCRKKDTCLLSCYSIGWLKMTLPVKMNCTASQSTGILSSFTQFISQTTTEDLNHCAALNIQQKAIVSQETKMVICFFRTTHLLMYFDGLYLPPKLCPLLKEPPTLDCLN